MSTKPTITCQKCGDVFVKEQPVVLTPRVPISLAKKLRRLANQKGVSLNQLMVEALASACDAKPEEKESA